MTVGMRRNEEAVGVGGNVGSLAQSANRSILVTHQMIIIKEDEQFWSCIVAFFNKKQQCDSCPLHLRNV